MVSSMRRPRQGQPAALKLREGAQGWLSWERETLSERAGYSWLSIPVFWRTVAWFRRGLVTDAHSVHCPA